MKIKLLPVLLIFCSLICLGQKKSDEAKINEQQIIIKKQIIVDDLENQLRDIQFATVRVFIRYKLADWLWKDGKDDTGRAEPLAVKAVEELFEKKDEIPSLYFNSLKPEIFALLEINAKNTAKKLSLKYSNNLGSDSELDDIDAILNKKNGDKIAADKIQKHLFSQTELSQYIANLIGRLQERKSLEASRLLNTILIQEETGRSDFSIGALNFIAQNFNDSMVSSDLRIRFFKIVLTKVGRIIQSPDADLDSAYDLLNTNIQEIAATAPNLLPEARILEITLSTRISQTTRENREINERIEASSDTLSAMISEAEKTEDFTLKYRLYERAARLASDENKFEIAIDLIEKTVKDESPNVFPALEFRIKYHDQFLNDVVEQCLKKEDAASAEYAIKKMLSKLAMAEGLRKSAVYYFEKQDFVSVSSALDTALKLTNDSEISTTKIYTLFRLISSIQKIEKSRLSEVTTMTAKAIDKIPTLSVDDKPGTKNYENYVISVMVTNWNLLPVFNELAKRNKNEAINFADRIGKNEIKIIAMYALLVDSLNVEKDSVKSNK